MKPYVPFIPIWFDDATLSPRAFRVLVHLWRRRNRYTGRCNPSVASIVASCQLHRDTVWKAIVELEDAGLLVRSRKGLRSSNQYDLVCLTGGKNQPVKLAGNFVPDVGKTGHHMAEKTGHKGYPLKVIQEGESISGPALSPFLSMVAEVEAMPEFANRSDVRAIADIIGPDRLRNAAHLAARVREERHPRYRRGGQPQSLPEPRRWREYVAGAYPNFVFLDRSSEHYAETWEQLPREYQERFSKEMTDHVA